MGEKIKPSGRDRRFAGNRLQFLFPFPVFESLLPQSV
jgi:hypothetical protein